MAAIELRDITKLFQEGTEEVLAVDDVSIEIEDGELVVFVGPSGSGKSTTLRAIAGLEKPTSGDVFLGGRKVNDVPPQDRNIAMVFQSFALYPHRTVRGNLSFPLEAQGVGKNEIDERVRNAAATLDIGELLDRKPSQLSGGQQQRVALGRAIIRDPDVFLMDEPLANLDAKLRKEMRTEVVRLQQELGVTMVHVTHNQEEAMTMGDRVVVMEGGHVQQVGPPDDVYRYPKNRFVAQFIGSPSMNLLEGHVEEGAFLAAGSDVTVAVPDRFAGLDAGDRLTLGIRPEDVDIGGEDSEYGFRATVDVIESLGNLQVVYFDVGGTEFLAEIDPDYDVSVGEEVPVSLQPDKLHLFDGVAPDSQRIVPGNEQAVPGAGD